MRGKGWGAGRLVSARAMVGMAACAAVLVVGRPARAASGLELAPTPTPTPVVAHQRQGPISIDGVLDEADWRAHAAYEGFIQRQPNDGSPSREHTSFAVLVDQGHVYVGVWALTSRPDRIRSLLSRRDVDTASDYVAVAFDSYRDRRSGYLFSLNAAGVQRDAALFDDIGEDASWDAVWEGAVSRDARGWYAEFRIPLAQLRYATSPDATWGIQVLRHLTYAGEVSSYFPFPQNTGRVVSHFGELRMGPVAKRRRVELLPYALLRGRWSDERDELPLTEDVALGGTLGLDARLGLGSAFTLTATINPDFGQVEADPSQINLSGSELFLGERRPFFVENAELFRLPLETSPDGAEGLVYSRRIGAAPHGVAPGDLVDVPDLVPILGAAKISGRTQTGISLGALHAVTPEVSARYVGDDGTAKHAIVEPWTHFSIGRLRKQWRGGATMAGLLATSVHRQVEDTPLDALLHRQALALGAEFDHRFGEERRWGTTWRTVLSHVAGSEHAIARTQTSQRHLFQRPGGNASFDPTRTSLTGSSVAVDVGRWSGPGLNVGTGVNMRSPGLELNDLGFQTSSNWADNWAWAGLRDDEPSAHVLRWAANASVWNTYDLSPRVFSRGLNASVNVTWKNWWESGAGFNVQDNPWQNGILRGGPSLRGDASVGGWASTSTDSRQDLVLGLNTSGRVVEHGHRYSYDGSASAAWQAKSNVELSLGISWSARHDDQYVAQVAAPPDPALHYIVASIRQYTASLVLRGNITFSPRLSLQAYVQPFLATGAYHNYRDVVRADAKGYDDRWGALAVRDDGATEAGIVGLDRDGDGSVDFAVPRPDFNVRELASNLVLRWEYRPGSTLFAIWSHNGDSAADRGTFVFGDEVAALAERGVDRFIIKANWWFGA